MWVHSERDPPYCRTPGPVGLSRLTRGPEVEPADEEPPPPPPPPLPFLEVKGGSLSAWDQVSAGLSGRWTR